MMGTHGHSGKLLKMFFADAGNMGDQLNRLIMLRLWGARVEHSRPEEAELCGIGSFLGMIGDSRRQATEPLRIWGTGFIANDRVAPGPADKFEVLALRGRLSREKLEKAWGCTLEVPLGDPGILVSRLFKEPIPKKHRLAIIPHFRERDDPRFVELANKFEDSVVIDLTNDPMLVIRQIAECERVLSSSLHGLIIADSFGIPNLHVKASDRLIGDGLKFADYYSSYGIEHVFVDLNSEAIDDLDVIDRLRKVTPEMVRRQQEALLACCPVAKLLEDGPRQGADDGSVLLSVVVPAYNVERYLRRSLESLLVAAEKVDGNVEFICVDDGSTDFTSAILDEYAADDSRFRVVKQRNGGAGNARNAGLDLARGEYLYFCDPDDRVEPDIFARAVECAKATGAPMVAIDFNSSECITPGVPSVSRRNICAGLPIETVPGGAYGVLDPKKLPASLFNQLGYAPWSKLFRRDFILDRRIRFQEIRRTNDMYFSCVAMANADKIGLVDEPLYLYCRNEGSVTRKSEHALCFCDALEAVKRRLEADGLMAHFGDAFKVACLISFCYNLETIDELSVLERGYPLMRARIANLVGDCAFEHESMVSEELRGLGQLLLASETPLPFVFNRYGKYKAIGGKTRLLEQKLATCNQRLATAIQKRDMFKDALEKTRADRDDKSAKLQEFRTACKLAKETVVQVRAQRDELARKLKELAKVVS